MLQLPRDAVVPLGVGGCWRKRADINAECLVGAAEEKEEMKVSLDSVRIATSCAKGEGLQRKLSNALASSLSDESCIVGCNIAGHPRIRYLTGD